MNTISGQYYEPYDSDVSDDSGNTDGTDESDLSDSEDPRIRRQEDPRYMILQSPSMNIPAKELSKDNPTNQYAEYDAKTDITSYKDLVYLNPPKATKSSLVCIRSDSRDTKVFPSPMNFTIKLPRVYKNIVKLQLVQIAFPNNTQGLTADAAFTSSFVNFLLKDGVPPCCIDACITTTTAQVNASAMGIVEKGRLNTSGTPLMTVVAVPDGAYNSSAQMGNELTYQANNTPPFNIISYEAFRDTFMNTRDISVLFNEPGDCFLSKTTNKRYGAHTKENIMTSYYTQQHIDSFPEITEVIAFNAYYYPILKELLATQRAKPFLNTGHLTFATIMNLVMGTFEGLQSDTYYAIGQLNQNALDIFRRTLTFELRNINKYQWVYNEDKRQFITIHDTLHTSLHNDIQKTYQTISNHELSVYGLHTNSFKALKASLIQYNCIYKHLETNLSTVLGNYHLVSGYQYHGGDTHSTIESTFQCVSDLCEDSDFTSMFCYKSTIGRIYGNYTGIPMNFTSFQDYHSTLSSYYTTIQSTNQTVSSIHGAITSQHHDYVSTKYQKVLPQSMIENKSYMTNQGVPARFITNLTLYVPGQSIVPRKGTNAINSLTKTAATTATTATSVMKPAATSVMKPAATSNAMSFQTLQTLPSDVATDINTVIIPDTSTNVFAAAVNDGCNNTCNCNDPTRVCCKYCSTMECGCTDICSGEVQSIVSSWYSCIPVNTIINTLSYRLGILNEEIGFNIVSTVNSILPPFNNNLFMSINDEMGFNNMDVAMPEDYAVTNDTTGQVKLMFAKIMFSGIGKASESQTLFQNPLEFETPLGKLDRLTFKVYYDDAAITPVWLASPFPLLFNEWNATVNIEEEVAQAGRTTGWGPNPTLPVPSNPSATPYLFYTSKDNPNNKKQL